MDPCNCANAELHCKEERREKLDYIRHDLTSQNVTWHAYDTRSLTQCFDDACRLYTEATGQKPQLGKVFRYDKKTNRKREIVGFAPIREMIVVIKPETTEQDVDNLCKEMQKHFGMTPLAFSIHRDEGHWAHVVDEHSGEVSKVWQPNYHAHLFFDIMERRLKDHKGKEISEKKRGRTIKFTEFQTSMMQDIAAKSLGMDRGEKGSKRTHEDQIEYKRKVQAEELSEAVKRINEKKSKLSDLEKQIEDKSAISSEMDRDIEKKESKRDLLQMDVDHLSNEHSKLETSISAKRGKSEELTESIAESQQTLSSLNEEIEKKTSELEGKSEAAERMRSAGDWLTGKSRRRAKEAEQREIETKEKAAEEIAKIKTEYELRVKKIVEVCNAKVIEANNAITEANQHKQDNQSKLTQYDSMQSRAITAEAKLSKIEEEWTWRETLIEKFLEYGAIFKEQWNKLFKGECVETNHIRYNDVLVPLDNPIKLKLEEGRRLMIHDQHWVTEQGFWYGIKKGLTVAFEKGSQAYNWLCNQLGGRGLRV